MRYKIYAYATDANNGGLQILQESAHRAGLPIHVLGLGLPWKGWRARMEAYKAAAAAAVDAVDYIVFCDAYDIVVHPHAQAKLDRLVTDLNDSGITLLVGAESLCLGFCVPLNDFHANAILDGVATGREYRPYANAGCMLGTPAAFVELYDWVLQQRPIITDDQVGLGHYMNAVGPHRGPHHRGPLRRNGVSLDHAQRLVTNYSGLGLLTSDLPQSPFGHYPSRLPANGLSPAYNAAVRAWAASAPPPRVFAEMPLRARTALQGLKIFLLAMVIMYKRM